MYVQIQIYIYTPLNPWVNQFPRTGPGNLVPGEKTLAGTE